MAKPDRNNPTASKGSMVCSGNIRITVLTANLIRFEWSEDAVFEDRKTLAVVNRRLPVPDYTVTHSDNKTVIQTASLTITSIEDGKPFSGSNLAVVYDDGAMSFVWRYGAADKRNLGGSIATLDGIQGRHHYASHDAEDGIEFSDPALVDLGDGLVSKSGWAVVDDSGTVALESLEDGREWATPRSDRKNDAPIDIYLLAYGHDFRKAVREAALIFGRQPLPPRYALGYWYSRYWAYTDREIEELIGQFDQMGLPIDVMVIDMDWHLQGWTGYTWDRRYFPDPDAHLEWLHERGLKATLNLHPADGVGSHEEAFPAMCRSLGLDESKTTQIPFDCGNANYMKAYFEHLHHPQEDRGVDFWWMDWQQGETSSVPGLRPLPWLNHTHWEDQTRRDSNRRPMSFSRYGGIGAGRSPVGFSGDTVSVWESLEFQPYFTATAANVLYGYWSHDIGGHMPGEIDPELYARWMQFGTYSPILRTHTTKNPKAERRIWEYPEPFRSAMMQALKYRYSLVPYIYTENRKCFDTGVSAVRPLYYDYPEQKEAYTFEDQYCFGDSMVVAPVIAPASGKDASASVSFWLPEGDWYDVAHGQYLRGTATHKRKYRIDETPVFVRSGSIIPRQAPATRLNSGGYEHLILDIYPGTEGAYNLYEDDGVSVDYQSGKFITIPISWNVTKKGRSLSIKPATGSYKGLKHKRDLDIRLVGARPTKRAVCTGAEVSSVSYDGDTATSVIHISGYDVLQGLRLVVTEDIVELPATDSIIEFSPSTAPAAGYRALIRRLGDIAALERLVSPMRPICDEDRLATEAAQTGRRVGAHPETYGKEVSWLAETVTRMPDVLRVFQAACRKKTSGFAAKQENIDALQKARDLLAATMKLIRFPNDT